VLQLTLEEQAELKHLRGAYIIASTVAAKIMTTKGTDDREALEEILKQARKAGAAIRRIEEIYCAERGATRPPNTLK
jgi:hypothetical protein